MVHGSRIAGSMHARPNFPRYRGSLFTYLDMRFWPLHILAVLVLHDSIGAHIPQGRSFRNVYLGVLAGQLLLTLWLRRHMAYDMLRTPVVAACRLVYSTLNILWLRKMVYESDSPFRLMPQIGRYGVLGGGLLTQNALALCMPVPFVWHLLIQCVTTGLMLGFLSSNAAAMIAQSERLRRSMVFFWGHLKWFCLATHRWGRSSILTPDFYACVDRSHENACIVVTIFFQLLLGFALPTACHSLLEVVAKDNFMFMWRRADARERGAVFIHGEGAWTRIVGRIVKWAIFGMFVELQLVGAFMAVWEVVSVQFIAPQESGCAGQPTQCFANSFGS